MICKGEILGTLQDPQEYFDSPHSEKDLGLLRDQTALLSRAIKLKAGTAEEKPKPRAREEESEGHRVRTDFGNGVPPDEENRKAGVHV
jgi:hypothetical protein